jgi:serine/threonine-protein kinase
MAPPAKPTPEGDDIILPDLNFRLELVRIPAGAFTMGGDGKYDGKPIHEVTLPEYFIGKYPVTNQQYATFAQATKRKFTLPKGKEQHPVVDVTWRDALAFCEWLSQASKRKVVLPSEAEWEKAARGPSTGSGDARPYPWGDAKPDKTLCNFGNNEKGTTPVGKYSPKGDSPYGCADMAGNVWEWTRSEKKDYPYRSGDGRESLDENKIRVVRGGSWDGIGDGVRAACRDGDDDFDHDDDLGFRVGCVSAPVP